MNVRPIQPIPIWTPQGEKSLTYLALANFFDYHFDGGSGKVTYKLIAMEGEPQAAVDYVINNLEIPSSIIQQWGDDDSIIWDYVANTLGLTLI
jgi:hypothetical protein